MLKYILILLLFPTVFFAVEWEQFSIHNSALKISQVREFYKDNKGKIWFITVAEIGYFDGNKIVSNNEFNKDFTLNGLMSIGQDSYNNLIFRTFDGSMIFLIDEKKFQTFETWKYDYLDLHPRSFVLKDSLIYLDIAELGRLAVFEYDTKKKEYFRNKNKDFVCDTNEFVYLGMNMFFFENKFVFRKGGTIFSLMDFTTKKFKEVTNIKGLDFKPNNNNTYLMKVVDNKLMINIINLLDSSSVIYKLNGSINDLDNLVAEKMEIPDYKSFDITFVQDFIKLGVDEYLFPAFLHLYYFKNGKFNKVKRPDIEYEDSIGFYPKAVLIDNEDIYVGTSSTGIFKGKLKEVLSDDNLFLSIENDFLPLNTLLSVYPLPSNNIVNCDFFIRNETLVDLKFNLYDIGGNLIPNSKMKLINTIGDLYKLEVELGNLINGTYLIKIRGNNSSLNFKVIKN